MGDICISGIELSAEVDSLVATLTEMHEKASGTDVTADKCKVFSGRVPKNEGTVYFDFESTGSDGSPLTSSAKFKNSILSADGTSVAAIASGGGGEGKTCALKAIGNLDDTKIDFRGVFCICLWGKSRIWLDSLTRFPRLWNFPVGNVALGTFVKKTMTCSTL